MSDDLSVDEEFVRSREAAHRWCESAACVPALTRSLRESLKRRFEYKAQWPFKYNEANV